MRVYYAAEGAFYAASVGMLLLWEERRRDFAVMMLHHLTTCGLIAASYSMRCAVRAPREARRQRAGDPLPGWPHQAHLALKLHLSAC